MITLKGIIISIRNEIVQYKILTRHFFNRLFQNDVVDFEDQMKERTIAIIAFLAIFSGLLTFGFLEKYSWIPDEGTSWIEKCALIIFFMLVMGFIAVLEWDVIIPDVRDYSNLTPLPLRTRTLLAAKFSSLSMFVGLFALGLNILSIPFFVLFLPQWKSQSFLYAVNLFFAHVLSMFLACFFAFFFNVILIGILMTFLGHKLFNRISTLIRSLLLVAHVLLLFLYMRVLFVGLSNIIPLEKLKANDFVTRHLYDLFPPFWFIDLYETLIGNTDLPFHGNYNFALIGLLVMIGVFYLTTGLSYRRYLKRLGFAQRKSTHFKRLRESFVSIFNWFFLRNPIQRAVFQFYGKTLKESMFHKMRLMSYIAIGIGIVAFQFAILDIMSKGVIGINKTTLSLPLILSFFFLLGLRGVVNMPVSLDANWIFQLTEVQKRRHYFSGLRKGVFFLNLLPLFLIIFVFFLFLWGGTTAFYHCLYGLIISVLLMEVFFLSFIKIPFACSYLPGKEKLQLFWIVYLFLFLAYVNIMAWIEQALLRTPSNFLAFYSVIFLIILGIRIYQLLFFYRHNKVKYEERLEPVLVDLGYKAPKHKRST